MSDDELIARLRNREGFVLEGPRRLMQACEEAANTIDRMRRANADRVAELAAKDARIAELEKINNELSGDSYHSMPTGHSRDSAEVWTYIEELKSALSVHQAEYEYSGADIDILNDRIASLEKSVTVLRELIPTLIEAAELGGIAWMPIWNRARAALSAMEVMTQEAGVKDGHMITDQRTRIASLEKSVTDARNALMTNPITQPEVSFLRNARKAALAILNAALAQAADQPTPAEP